MKSKQSENLNIINKCVKYASASLYDMKCNITEVGNEIYVISGNFHVYLSARISGVFLASFVDPPTMLK